jgi:hypothetical protein
LSGGQAAARGGGSSSFWVERPAGRGSAAVQRPGSPPPAACAAAFLRRSRRRRDEVLGRARRLLSLGLLRIGVSLALRQERRIGAKRPDPDGRVAGRTGLRGRRAGHGSASRADLGDRQGELLFEAFQRIGGDQLASAGLTLLLRGLTRGDRSRRPATDFKRRVSSAMPASGERRGSCAVPARCRWPPRTRG